MKILEFDHYNLCGPRELLESLCAFYTDTVGLTIGYRPRFEKFGYWLYVGDHAVLHLTESSQNKLMSSDQSSFNHVAFNCSGLLEFQRRLSELGVEYTTARIPERKRVQLFLSDPAGNGVELNFAEE